MYKSGHLLSDIGTTYNSVSETEVYFFNYKLYWIVNVNKANGATKQEGSPIGFYFTYFSICINLFKKAPLAL